MTAKRGLSRGTWAATTPGMRRTWTTLVVLALVAGTAAAQPDRLAATTDAATAALAKDQKDRNALVAQKATLAKRYESELAAVDRLKQQRKSWRRERQLQDAQAKALDTSKEIAKLTTKIGGLDTRIATDKRAVVVAVDAELPGVTDATRKRQLTASRAAASPPVVAKAHKIVVPDAEIDPLADPEELDQQASALRTTEGELTKQIEALDQQTKRLVKAAELRKAHERAGDLAVRDDDQPRRTGASGTRTTGAAGDGLHGVNDDSPAPAETDPTDMPPPMGGELGGFQGDETATVLSEVIDPATSDALRKAARTSDPATKAAAAKAARDEAKTRLEALRKQRAAIEARAKELRKK
jgi:hypothetical protein